MIQFDEVSLQNFLAEYWQKKPLVFRQAFSTPAFVIPANELAGLSLEDDIESRIVIATPDKAPYWHLKKGPFTKKDFKQLPETAWTLLVQGVDRFVPEIAVLFEHFNSIPQWRVDDLMISYAAKHGSVGPHYDNYDVFLYQAKGARKWSLTTKDCNENNAMPNVPLRLMQHFDIEEEYILAEGDMLYLPPHVGHYGVAVSDECITYSFGYRSYVNRELWEHFGDYYAEQNKAVRPYKAPEWHTSNQSSELSKAALINAKSLMQEMLDDEIVLSSWFGCFVTQLDPQAEALLPLPHKKTLKVFMSKLNISKGLMRHPCCRFAYYYDTDTQKIDLFINGTAWNASGVSVELVQLVANQRMLALAELQPWLSNEMNQAFLYQLWSLQWLTHF